MVESFPHLKVNFDLIWSSLWSEKIDEKRKSFGKRGYISSRFRVTENYHVNTWVRKILFHKMRD